MGHIKAKAFPLAFIILTALANISLEAQALDTPSAFLADIVRLDMAKYSVTVVNYGSSPTPSIPDSQTLSYQLYGTNESRLDAAFLLVSGHIKRLTMRQYHGVQLRDHLADSVLEEAILFFERYLNYSGADYLTTFDQILDLALASGSPSVVLGDVKFSMSATPSNAELYWVYNAGEFDFTQKSLDIKYDSNGLTVLADDWDLYDVGSAILRMSEEQAIGAGAEIVRNMSIGIIPNATVAKLGTQVRTGNLLFPLWTVWFRLDTYFGYVNRVSTLFWADTGELAGTYAVTDSGQRSSVSISANSTQIVLGDSVLFTADRATMPNPPYSCSWWLNSTRTYASTSWTIKPTSEGTYIISLSASSEGGGGALSNLVTLTVLPVAPPATPTPTQTQDPTPTPTQVPTPTITQTPKDVTPPRVYMLSPTSNESFEAANLTSLEVSLNFTVDEQTSQLSFSLDGQPNATITGNYTFRAPLAGLHNLTVYAWDSAGNVGASETVDFSIVVAQEQSERQSEPSLILPVAASATSMGVAAVAFVVYLNKRKRDRH